MNKPIPKWFRLDNAAKIYPAFATKEDPATFRVAAILHEDVNEDRLQMALDATIKRFPSMAVSMKKGMFWYYFEENPKKPVVYKEVMSPCSAINEKQNNGFLFKVIYYKRRIALECFHALTDGYGAMEFLKALVFAYLKQTRPELDHEGLVKIPEEAVLDEEIEDSYRTYYKPNKQVTSPEGEVRAKRIYGTPLGKEGIKVSHGLMSASKLNAVAKKRGATITIYLTAILIKTIYDMTKHRIDDKRPIVVTVPVNLRRLFPSRTLRNFSYFVNVAVEYTDCERLDRIIQVIKVQMQEGLSKKKLYQHMHYNMSFEKNIFIRLTPNVIKNLLLKQVRNLKSKKAVTTTLSNTGIVHMPKAVANYVEHFEFVLYAARPHYMNVGIGSYNNRLVISMSRAMKEQELVNQYFDNLAKESGIAIDVYSNDRGKADA